MDDNELIELINKRYDEIQEHIGMDMDRDEHENLMLSLAHEMRELKERQRTFVINPRKYTLAYQTYKQLCILLDSHDEKYEIYIQEPTVLFMTTVSIVVLANELEVYRNNASALKDIISHIDGFSVRPGSDDRVRLSFEIDDVYIEIGEDEEPIPSRIDDAS